MCVFVFTEGYEAVAEVSTVTEDHPSREAVACCV